MAKLKISPAIVLIALKASKLVSLLKLAKFTKIIVTATTMLGSILAYNLLLGPWMAVGLVVMLFVHEMGHVIAMRQKGMPTALPIFIPFLGAAIFVPAFGDRYTESFIGYGGPLLGTVGTLLCLLAWGITGWDILLPISFFGAYLNLFNLIPIRPLDGGRILQIVGDWIKYIGLLLIIGYTIFMGEPSLIILWIFLLQEFTLPLWWRSMVAGMLTITMGYLFAMGNSGQPWFIDLLDIVVGSVFTTLFLLVEMTRYKRQKSKTPVLLLPDDPRPYPELSMRLSWLVMYFGLAIILWLTLWFQIEHLPK
jgi:Zn-dependent protease